MLKNISKPIRLLTNFFLIFFSFNGFSQFLNQSWGEAQILSPNNSQFFISFAVTDAQKTKGLSGLKPEKMAFNQGLLFIYSDTAARVFWMPDTYFDLDIIFLDETFKVIGLEENVKHHIGYYPESDIVRTKSYMARYILELHAGQSKKANLKAGDSLRLKTRQNLIVPGLDFSKIK